jgi:hypothetical protein
MGFTSDDIRFVLAAFNHVMVLIHNMNVYFQN